MDVQQKRIVAIIGLLVLIGLCGCQNTARHPCDPTERVLKERRENMAATTQVIRESEMCRPEQLASTVQTIEHKHREDVQNFSRDSALLNRWIKKEFEAWQKNQPEYRKQIEKELNGDPDNIARTAPRLIY